jgi:hypothetical protein
MATKKFEIIDRSLVISDTGSGVVEAEFPAKDVYFMNRELNDNSVVKLYDTNGVNEFASTIYDEPLANCVDANLVAFTESTFRDFSRVSLGFSIPAGGPSFSKTVTTAEIGTDQNDFSPTGWDSSIAFLRVDPVSSNIEITGIDSTGFKHGQSLFIANINSVRSVKLTNNDSASLPDNRFISKGDTTLVKEEGILVVYDAVSKRWRLDKAD